MDSKTATLAYHPGYRETLQTSAWVTAVLLVFFFFFQPNKVAELEEVRWLSVVCGLVLTSFATMLVSQLLLQRSLFRNAPQAFFSWPSYITMSVCSLMALGLAIFLYFYWLEFIRFQPVVLMKIQMRTLLIGLSPMIVLNRLLAKATEGAQSRRPRFTDPCVSLSSDNGREVLTLRLSDLLFVASADNYVVIFSRSKNGVKRDLLRTGLSRVEQGLQHHPNLFRCHRTAIVNLRNVRSATGNSRGYRLRFEGVDKVVPVARSKVATFRKRIAQSSPDGC